MFLGSFRLKKKGVRLHLAVENNRKIDIITLVMSSANEKLFDHSLGGSEVMFCVDIIR